MGIRFHIDAWGALAPGLNNVDSWRDWLQNPENPLDAELAVSLGSIPALIRRRFRTLGKCAVGAALPILEKDESIPSIFSSRHGDTALTISLLEDIGRQEPVSPAAFSLAVHNAVSGLFSIARKDTSEITSIAAMESIVFHTICEALGQLQKIDRILCVIYDVPLPEFFGKYCVGEIFPYAIAMIISNSGSQAFELEQSRSGSPEVELPQVITDSESFTFLRLLTGITNTVPLGCNQNAWQVKRVDCQ